jgi:hypothetical protein
MSFDTGRFKWRVLYIETLDYGGRIYVMIQLFDTLVYSRDMKLKIIIYKRLVPCSYHYRTLKNHVIGFCDIPFAKKKEVITRYNDIWYDTYCIPCSVPGIAAR